MNLFPSKVRPVLAKDFGYGNGIFYPQLSYYITTFIYLIIKQIGFSLITAIKIFEFIVTVLSGYFMYKFINTVFSNSNIAIIGSIMYMTSPYLMYDMFQRMAYSEICIFVFIPIVALSIYYILNKNYKKFFTYFVIGYVGMILSHLVMTVYFTILLVFVLLYNWKLILNKKTILYFLCATIMVLTITSPFTMPMFEHKIKGNYVVFQDNTMTYLEKIEKHSLNLDNLLSAFSNTKGSKYTNLMVVILFLITILNRKNILKDKKENILINSILIFTLLSMVISSELISWSKIPKILWNIQFPWRMCTFIAFGISTVACISLRIFNNEDVIKLIIIIISIVCLQNASYCIHKKDLKPYENITYSKVSSTTNHAMGNQKEYLPVNALENIEYLRSRNRDVIIKQGNADIDMIKDKTPYLEFKVNNNNNAIIEIPRLFYLGYNIELITENGTKENIEYYENENGFIEFKINNNGKIIVDYTGTTINKIANVLSIISIIIFIGIFIKNKKCKEEVA